MCNLLQTLTKIKTVAEICGFFNGSLLFINSFKATMDSKRVLPENLFSSALFYCANCMFICPHAKAPAAYALSKYNFNAIILKRGLIYALASFLGILL